MEPSRRRNVAIAVVAVLVAWIAADPPGDRVRLATEQVPSFWDDADLMCRTTALDVGRRSIERFRCRPTGADRPPPGRYTQATTTWRSDIDRRVAFAHDILIRRSGTVAGWAAY